MEMPVIAVQLSVTVLPNESQCLSVTRNIDR